MAAITAGDVIDDSRRGLRSISEGDNLLIHGNATALSRPCRHAGTTCIRSANSSRPTRSRAGGRSRRRSVDAWDWRQANGAPRAMVCRGLMLALERAGHIELPAVRRRPPNPLARARAPGTGDGGRNAAAGDACASWGRSRFVQVRRTPDEASFNSLLQAHHYLGYSQPVGEQLKFMVYAGTRPVALFAWSSAPRHLGPRDRFLGWSPTVRRAEHRRHRL